MSRRSTPPGSGIEQRLLRWFSIHSTSQPDALLVGFSGGVDSLALALALSRLGRSLPPNPILVHVDHQLRPDSEEQAFVARDYAKTLGLQFESVKIKGNLRELHPGAGIEEAARRERYAAFAKLSGEYSRAPVLTAHHADDQAETVLLHLFRGSGLSGVSGMGAISALDVPWWKTSHRTQFTGNQVSLQLWRPFLKERKKTLRDYVDWFGMSPLEDSTNSELGFARNRVRNRFIPIAEEVLPGATEAIVRFANTARAEDAFLNAAVNHAFESCDRSETAVPLSCFDQVHVVLSRRFLHQWLSQRLEMSPGSERVEAVLDLINRPTSHARIELGLGYIAQIADGCLIVAGNGERTSHGGENG